MTEKNNRFTILMKELCVVVNSIVEENEKLKKQNYELHRRLGDFEPFERK